MKFFLTVVMIMATLPAFGSSKKQTFNASMDEVFDSAVKTAQQDWNVTYADRKLGIISFNTGTSFTSNGMECSASLKDLHNGQVEVSLKTQKKNGQIFAWNVGKRIADKFFTGIRRELDKETPSAPAAERK